MSTCPSCSQARRDFQAELQEARPKAQRITAALCELGILHKAIDVERAGMLALIESPDGLSLGDLISLGDKSKDDVLRDVRHTEAVAAARAALGVKDHGHFTHIQEILTPSQSVANWMAEIWFDQDESRYALIGEYIQPIPAPPGWRRLYSVYQAKASSGCDVPGCGAFWYERKVTRSGHCVHVCRRHQEENADALFRRSLEPHPALRRVEPCPCEIGLECGMAQCPNIAVWRYDGLAVCIEDMATMAAMNSDNAEAFRAALMEYQRLEKGRNG